jgi:hypothetical protein
MQVLEYWKVSALRVPKIWNDKKKATLMGVWLEHLMQYEADGVKFLDHVVGG